MILELSFFSISVQSQSFNCGTDSTNQEQYAEFVKELAFTERSASVIYNIPICFHFVKGLNSAINTDFDPIPIVNAVSSYFNSTNYNCSNSIALNFYACSVDYTTNDNLLNFNLNTDWQTLYDGIPSCDNAINIYAVSQIIANQNTPIAIGGVAKFPTSVSPTNMIVISGGGFSVPKLIAHELGHYFGLRHTFQGLQFGAYPSTLTYSGGSTTYNCNDSGDLICDTDGDPGYNTLGQPYCSQFNNDCNQPLNCSILDPLGNPYHPSKDNLMSYYGCSFRFSCEQFERMSSVLQNTSPIFGNRNFLIDNNVPNCQTFVSVKGVVEKNCTPIPGLDIEGIHNLDVKIDKSDSGLNSNCTQVTSNGKYSINQNSCNLAWTPNSNITVTPDVNFQLNNSFFGATSGVTTADLLAISKHLLNITPFVSPFQLIAADANNSGSVTTFDIVKIRKVILGIHQDFSPVGNWRFIPKYCFDDPTFLLAFNPINPFAAIWHSPNGINREYLGVNSFMDKVDFNLSNPDYLKTTTWSFNGMKTGDVNCNAEPYTLIEPSGGLVIEGIPHLPTIPTKTYTLKVIAKGDTKIAAYQLGFDFAQDSLQVIEAQAGTIANFSMDNFGMTHLADGEFRTVWYQPSGIPTDVNGKTLFQIKIKATKNIANIANRFVAKKNILPAKFYDTNGNEIKTISLKLELVSAIGLDEPNIADRNQIINEEVKPIVIPNPSRGEANIQFVLPNPNKVQLILFDQMGRMLRSQEDTFSDGEITWPIQDFSDLPTGVYGFALIFGDNKVFGKIAKI
jgi:Pregnancy-associated plasma protein-A